MSSHLLFTFTSVQYGCLYVYFYFVFLFLSSSLCLADSAWFDTGQVLLSHQRTQGAPWLICVLDIFLLFVYWKSFHYYFYFIFKLRLPVTVGPPKCYFSQHTPTDCMVRRNIQDGKHLNKILLMLVFVIVLLTLILLFVHIARDRRVRSTLLLSCVSLWLFVIVNHVIINSYYY